MRTANHALVWIFLVAISLPLAANMAGYDGADPAAENRELAPFPRFDRTLRSIPAFAERLGAWFDDHFGFRSALVRWHGESRLFLLGVSPTAAVVKGADGWFFYGDDGSIEDYTNERPLSEDAVRGWRETLTRTDEWLRERRIAFLFAVAPDKYVIYPELMPSTLRRVGDASRTDQVYAGLAGSRVAAVDLRPALRDARARERIFQKTDTHWNDRGALAAYQQMIGVARAQVPAIPPAWTREEFDSEDRTVAGMDLAAMMGLKRVLAEIDLALVPRRARRSRVVTPPGAMPTDEEGLLITEIPGSTLPRAVIFRDSFVSRLVPFLSEHFSRAVYLWQNDFDADVVLKEHPDIVIQEIVGRRLYNFIPSPELIPQ